jgi:hypothetical protein
MPESQSTVNTLSDNLFNHELVCFGSHFLKCVFQQLLLETNNVEYTKNRLPEWMEIISLFITLFLIFIL